MTKIATKDHTGRYFSSVEQMFTFYGLSRKVFYKRKQQGWTLQQILTTPHRAIRGRPKSTKSTIKEKDYREISEFSYELTGGHVTVREYQQG